MNHKYIYLLSMLIVSVNLPASAQILSDRKNAISPSKVNTIDKDYFITSGTKRGQSLFHRFKEFNINSGENVYFKDTRDTENLILFVSGKNRSILNGFIDAGLSENLFFINPNGILVLDNFNSSSLNSINLSTAHTIEFSDKFKLSKNTILTPSNTDSIPRKLFFNGNSRSIFVRNIGTIFSLSPANIISSNNFPDRNVNVNEKGRIFLSASSINSDGGLFFAPDGEVIIRGIKAGEIELDNLEYINKLNLQGNINFKNYSAIDVSGKNSGKIYLGAKSINLRSGSTIVSQTLNNINSNITIQSVNLNIIGVEDASSILTNSFIDPTTSSFRYITSISHLNLNGDTAANINLNSDNINITSGGAISGIGVLNGTGANLNFKSNSTSISRPLFSNGPVLVAKAVSLLMQGFQEPIYDHWV